MNNIKNQKVIKAFGNRVRVLRLIENWSQEQLANNADIPISQIGRIERGEINTTISTIFALAKALNVPVEDMIKEIRNK